MNSNPKRGYYHLWISAPEHQRFFRTSHEKAYFLSLLQDTLSPRRRLHSFSSIADILSVEVSLLAYSLTDIGIHLLVYTMREAAIDELSQRLVMQYVEHLNESDSFQELPFNGRFFYDHLAGPHEALNVSREIHLLHRRWRTDRYSSIGFYLDDRRGEWMSLWRLSILYENQPELYLRYLQSGETETDQIFQYLYI